jgi:Fe-S-cluster containining protein
MADAAGLPGSPCVAHACSACCHGTEMMLTEADLARLQAARPGEVFWRDDDGDVLLRTVGGPEGPCWFLDAAGRCTVYADRPDGCRLYPAIWDVDEHRVRLDDEGCPFTAEFAVPRAVEDAVRRLAARLVAEGDARRAAKP